MSDYSELHKLITALYQEHPTGGPLHVELDDRNLHGDSRQWEPAYYLHADEPNFACLVYVCERICELMAPLSPEERAVVVDTRDTSRDSGWPFDAPAIGGDPCSTGM